MSKELQHMDGGKVVLYQNRLEVQLKEETVWLTQQKISELFEIDRSVVTKHLRNIFKSKELEEKSNVQKMHIAQSDKPVKIYNLDIIISVGYRVNSKRGTQFRIWATNVLRAHLLEGYTINEKRLKKEQQKFIELKNAIALIGNVARIGTLSDEAQGLAQVISEYTRALDMLDDFDHEKLKAPKGRKHAKYEMTYDDACAVIEAMRKKFNNSALMGQEKDESFKSSIGAIYQTVGGKDAYPTIEEKAAHLLYFVTKNHSFVDGNKRIAAALFVCFLERNGILYRKDGSRTIDNNALVALTLMIASSRPQEKNIMVRVMMNLLCG
jgi:prophage maintenance system killer protein